MSKVTPDRAIENIIESAIAATLMNYDGATLMKYLTVFADECGATIYDWFVDQDYQFVAIAWTEMLATRIKPEPASVYEYLLGLPRGVAVDLVNGKTPNPWVRCEPEESVYRASNDAQGKCLTVQPIRDEKTFRNTCQKLKHARDRRDMIDGLRAVAIRISSCSLDNGPADAAAQGIDLLGAMLGKPRAVTIGHGMGSAMDLAECIAADRASGVDRTCSWGIQELDDIVPMRPGGLYVLAARPKVGKTSLALQAVVATSMQHRVAMVSLEMGCEDLAVIVASRKTGIPGAAISKKDDRITDTQWQELRNLAQEWQETARIVVLDSGTTGGKVTADTISAWARQQKQTRGIGLLVVDYCQLVNGNDPRAREYDTVSNTTRALKQLAGALKIPVLLLSQLNRDMEKGSSDKPSRPPKLSDLRGSGSIEQDADAVVFIHRDIMAQGYEVPAKLIVAANRRGQAGEIEALFRPAHQTFRVDVAPIVDVQLDRAARAASPPSESENLFL